MKRFATILTTIFFLSAFAASAQMQQGMQQQNNQQQNMMMQQGSMMQGMMNNGICPMCGQMMNQDMPMQKYGMMVNRLPNMQQQLSLSNEQVDQLYDLQAGFKKQQIDYLSELRKKQMKLKGLLNDMAPAGEIKKQLEVCSKTLINMGAAAYETAGKMKAVLNSDQKEQLKSMMMQQGGMMQGTGGMIQKQNNQ